MTHPQPKHTGTFWGVPYDWRKPTKARYKSRLWNTAEPRLFTPRAWGWGYDVNFYRLFHPSVKTGPRRTKR